MSDDGLNDQAGDGCCNPKNGNILYAGSQCLKNAAYVGILECEAKLNAQEPETHVPDLPKGKVSLFHVDDAI